VAAIRSERSGPGGLTCFVLSIRHAATGEKDGGRIPVSRRLATPRSGTNDPSPRCASSTTPGDRPPEAASAVRAVSAARTWGSGHITVYIAGEE
jgi:hypothetical protein